MNKAIETAHIVIDNHTKQKLSTEVHKGNFIT
jgi:hypothetical protein